jgi:dienelactone hydrolase
MNCYRSHNVRKVRAMDPVVVARKVVDLTREGRFAEVEDLFGTQLRAVASAGTLRAGWAGELSRIGPVRSVGAPESRPSDAGLVRVSVPVTGERGSLTVLMSVDGTGRLAGLRLAAPAGVPWQPPRYARPSRFTEREVTVGPAPLAVPGTLTLPRGRGPWPGVVLLAGAGPFDRDATIGPNKPLKDIAWGLASRGIAVARFDKVTHVHPRTATDPGFTMVEEYLPHALATVRLLQGRPGVDPTRVHLLGHSGGGRAAPRIAAADPSIAGLVILAGDAAPLPWSAVRVAHHLAALDPGPDARAAVEALTIQAAAVDDPDLSPDTPAADLLFGWPASYWLDLRGYDQVATAAALDRPMLVLQGGRDHQVTVDDDLARWRAGLAHRPDVTIRVHDADDHLFFPGERPSTPADTGRPQHVDPAVVAEVADRLAPRRRLLRLGYRART